MRRVPGHMQQFPRAGASSLIWLRFLAFPLILVGGLVAAGAFLAGLVVALAYPNLPSLEVLTDISRNPLARFTPRGPDRRFGEDAAPYFDQEVPSSSSTRFSPPRTSVSTSTQGSTTSAWRGRPTPTYQGGRLQGASTITMQVARNFSSPRKTLTRKPTGLLAFKIETTWKARSPSSTSTIYLGQRAYGFAAAAQSLRQIRANCRWPRWRCWQACPGAGRLQPCCYPQRAHSAAVRAAAHEGIGHITDTAADPPSRPCTAREVDESAAYTRISGRNVRQAVLSVPPCLHQCFRVYTTIRRPTRKPPTSGARACAPTTAARLPRPEAFVQLPPAATEDDPRKLAAHPDFDDLKVALVLAASAKESSSP